jgi:opacity protein-like surface antigen
MKNSAWYHKLWRKKLNQYPIKDSADTAWAEMQALLDEHLPGGDVPGSKPARFLGGTIISVLSFVLPSAAMIGALTFAAIKHQPKKIKTEHKNTYKAPLHDSLLSAHNTDTLSLKPTANSLKPAAGTSAICTNKVAAVAIGANNPVTRSKLAGIVTLKQAQANSGMNISLQNKKSATVQPDQFMRNPVIIADNNEQMRQQLIAGTGLTPPWAVIKEMVSAGNKGLNYKSITGGSAGGTSKITVKDKIKTAKAVKLKKQDAGGSNSPFDFSIDAGVNTSGAGSNLIFGLQESVAINSRLSISTGVRADLSRTISTDITHKSYNRADSITFKVNDSRKVNSIAIPVRLDYKLGGRVSVYGGAQLNFSVSQGSHTNKVHAVADYRDTLSHTQTIDSALRTNSINKTTIGVFGGVSVRLNDHFAIEGTYLQNLSPYKVNTALGNSRLNYHSVQFGIRYTFKRKK